MRVLFVLLSFVLSSAAFATTENSSHPFGLERALSPTLQPGIFQQAIEHSDPSAGTFSQRYWVNSDYATSAAAPVIYHICGEGACDDGYFLRDNAIEWAKSLGARIVYLEHRYYGSSLPFSDLAASHMKYLTLENVMADLSTFQKYISEKNGWTGKWIVVGGSYSGTLSALYRQKYPDLVVGALASSAPMIPGKGDLAGIEYAVEYASTAPSDGRSWIYQACTDFDFWEADGGGPTDAVFRPSTALCTTLFGNIRHVNTADYDQKYNQPFISNSPNAPSKILFTYGGNDVWTQLGLSQEPNQNSHIQILMIPGAGHHFDLNEPSTYDSADVVKARQVFLDLAKQWLQ